MKHTYAYVTPSFAIIFEAFILGVATCASIQIEGTKTTSMEKEKTIVLSKYRALFET